MGAEKLSISLDAELAASVRTAAAERGMSVSTWLADAAEAQVRQVRLGEALKALAAEIGDLEEDEAARLVAQAHRNSVIISGAEGRA